MQVEQIALGSDGWELEAVLGCGEHRQQLCCAEATMEVVVSNRYVAVRAQLYVLRICALRYAGVGGAV